MFTKREIFILGMFTVLGFIAILSVIQYVAQFSYPVQLLAAAITVLSCTLIAFYVHKLYKWMNKQETITVSFKLVD